jgi:hypothetical protein
MEARPLVRQADGRPPGFDLSQNFDGLAADDAWRVGRAEALGESHILHSVINVVQYSYAK